MNKVELSAAIASETGLSKKDSEAVVKAFVDVVTEELKKGGKVQLVGFRSRLPRPRNSRPARHSRMPSIQARRKNKKE